MNHGLPSLYIIRSPELDLSGPTTRSFPLILICCVQACIALGGIFSCSSTTLVVSSSTLHHNLASTGVFVFSPIGAKKSLRLYRGIGLRAWLAVSGLSNMHDNPQLYRHDDKEVACWW
jgi:hypothetical protein